VHGSASLRTFEKKVIPSRTDYQRISSVHDVIVAIDVKRLAGDEARGVVRQESGGDAHIVDAHQTARRRFRLGPVEQGVEFGKSARMEGS